MSAADTVRVAGQAGEAITLPLGQPPASGYEWRLQLPAGIRQLPIKRDTAAAGAALGDPPTGAIQVQAVQGTFRIVAHLTRPWEPDQPSRTMIIELVVS